MVAAIATFVGGCWWVTKCKAVEKSSFLNRETSVDKLEYKDKAEDKASDNIYCQPANIILHTSLVMLRKSL